jgi:hypothetical protein
LKSIAFARAFSTFAGYWANARALPFCAKAAIGSNRIRMLQIPTLFISGNLLIFCWKMKGQTLVGSLVFDFD